MILHFIITVLVIYGIKASTRQGMILFPVYVLVVRALDRLMGERLDYITKPLFDCTPCMASVYGSLSYWLYSPDPSVMGWLVWVFALCGFNYLINKVI